MAIQTQRVGGQLVETDNYNTKQLAKLAGTPVGPTTPAGVETVGGNPDQAKMAGTPAQKQPVIQDATKPQETLQTAQRTQAPRQQVTAPEEQAAQKANQLMQLGSLHTRVEALIAKDLKLQAPAQGQLSEQQVAALPAEVRAQAETLLNAVIANPQDQNALAAATQFWRENGLATVDNFTPEQFIATAQQSLGKQAAEQVRDTVQLANLELGENERAALEEVFGDTWQQFTVPQLAQAVEDMRQREFSRAQSLRAELASATGARREQLLTELNDLGQSGIAGTEAGVKEIAQQIDKADTVQIGGETY